MAISFKAVDQRWPGKRGIKGLIFGTWFGGVWSFGFLTGWAFLGTTLRSEVINIAADLIPLAIAGWLIGLTAGRDIPGTKIGSRKPWLAILLVAFGFVAVHTLGLSLLADPFRRTAILLLLPTNTSQVLLLLALGIWVGGMYIVLRTVLPFQSSSAQAALFAFGIFGPCWTWFNLFFAIEFSGVIPTLLILGFMGSLGVFIGAIVYEGIQGVKRPDG
jgi:hypothetical protein